MPVDQINPTVSVIGCGGCGVNMVKRLMKSLPDDRRNLIKFKVIDTAKSNFSDLENVDIVSIGELGSGKDRTKNAGTIRSFFDTHAEYGREATDVTILIASFAGGSGSNISPILTERILRHNNDKAVVVVGVVDTCCERDCMNSITTLRSFDKVATDLGICIPMLVFSNTIMLKDLPKPGRMNVDRSVVSRLSQFINLITGSDITELDWADKMAFLRPQDSGCTCGLCNLSVSATDLEHTVNLPGETIVTIGEHDIVHSLLVVNNTGTTPDILSDVAYVGVSAAPYICCMSEGLPSTLTQDLADTAQRFAHSERLKNTMSEDLKKFGKEDKSGLVL